MNIYAVEIMGMYCKVCERNGEPDQGFSTMEMELVNIEEKDCEHSVHTYEGRCPVCGTLHRYISFREEADYTFEMGE